MTPAPRKCIVTKAGLVLLAAAILALLVIFTWQRMATGSFSRGNGFVAPMWIKDVMLYGTPLALVVLLVGSVVDAARYSAWKRREKTPA